MGLFLNPEFWVAVAFVIAVGLMWWKGSGAIATMLDARANRIEHELDEARRLHDEAKRALEQYRQRQQEALTEAKEIAERARREAEQMVQQSRVELEHTIKRREELAEERIAQVEASAIAEIRGRAVDIAVTSARALITDSLSGARGAAAIDAAIKALPAQLH